MAKSPPKPGKKVRSSESGRPIMALLDLLGRRWALRIIWELREGPLRFRGLQEASGGLSPTLLNQRLRELREADAVELTDKGYRLTKDGEELFVVLAPLNDWAEKWALRTSNNEVT
ncbi:transcriptional regulator, HxlR family [Desulfatibacillum aliphaticivorans]|uniref:Transcriptional regulator, HxlR family n=1 Tax=Desulfatibacillum aliphaticivorans TaxID=218208 RepID=B8FLL0_DESAL|nr:helix-turn-helix domain-containing protein [Desulfatibacillum aliphaticivorans]ACL05364.1 transcriptional regulator, HxlR family [Desulfatibacillum aliphaticivorans]